MQIITPDFKGENKGHYSAGVISNGTLYISGQLSVDPDTREVCQGDIKDHTRLALKNVDRVLKAAGVDRDHVVFCRVYTPDVQYWDRLTKFMLSSLVSINLHESLFQPLPCISDV